MLAALLLNVSRRVFDGDGGMPFRAVIDERRPFEPVSMLDAGLARQIAEMSPAAQARLGRLPLVVLLALLDEI